MKEKCDDEEEKVKDVAMLRKAIRVDIKADQMRVAPIKKAQGVVAKHQDHEFLLEIVKPNTSIFKSAARMNVIPSVASMETNMPTLII